MPERSGSAKQSAANETPNGFFRNSKHVRCFLHAESEAKRGCRGCGDTRLRGGTIRAPMTICYRFALLRHCNRSRL